MATINKTIATSGGDYTSMSLFEASIPGSGTDDYIGTYIEAMTDTTIVAVSFGTSNTMTVDVSAAYRCNGAVSGSHAELVYTTADANDLIDIAAPTTIKNLRIKRTTTNASGDAINFGVGGTVAITLDRCTIIGAACAGRVLRVLGTGTGAYTVKGCFIVDNNRPAGGAANDVIFWRNAGANKFYRNTVFLANNTAAGLLDSNLTGTDIDARQNLLIKAAGATATNGCYYVSSSGTFASGCDANGASDATSPGTNANNSLTPANVIKTLTVGSEDLHYPSRAAMLVLTAGSSLSGTVGTVDLDGDTINAWYPGADYAYGIPTMSLVTPSSGPTAGGTAVTLTGTNFTGATGVTFGGTAATGVSVVSDTSITCTTPLHAAGAVSVVATNGDGSNVANSLYTYIAAAVTGIGSAVRLRFSDLGFGRR